MSEYRHLDEIEENLRRMAESSNRIEGFVLFADGFDGFSGVNERLLEFVNDEYDRKSLLFNVNEPWSRTTPYRYYKWGFFASPRKNTVISSYTMTFS